MPGFRTSVRRIGGLLATGTVIAGAMVATATPAGALPPTAPEAPTSVSAVDGPAADAATIFFTPGADNGSAITGYTVTPSAAPTTPQSCDGSGCTVTGLTGPSYTFTVIETNGVGSSSPSAASNSVTPAAVPTLTFSPSTPNTALFAQTPTVAATSNASGGAITYDSTNHADCTVTAGGVVTFLTANTCHVKATQAATASHPGATATHDIAVTAGLPQPPTNLVATPGSNSATLTFTAPTGAALGGDSVDSYSVAISPTPSPNPATQTCLASGCSINIVDGTLYTLSVKTVTDAGSSTSAATTTVKSGGAAQTINSWPTIPTQSVGVPLTLSATASSGLPVTFTSKTPTICTVGAGNKATFLAVGNCTINADQSGDASHASAPTASQTFAVSQGSPTVAVTSSANPSPYGQEPTFTATVAYPPVSGVSAPTTTGQVQWSVDGTNVGSAVTLSATGTATYTPTTPLSVASHVVKASYLGDANNHAAVNQVTQVVNKANTTTTVQVSGNSLGATVAPVAPGAGTPTGTVSFTVGGTPVGSAPLTAGVATFTAPGTVGNQGVSATYSGDTNFATSSGNRTAIAPTVKAHVTSAHAKHRGWYRSAVHVSFTCTPNTAPLDAAGCPGTRTLRHNGVGRTVTVTVTQTDGGTKVLTVGPFNIDGTAPSLSVTRHHNSLVCHAHDSLSHGATCHITRRSTVKHGVVTVHWKAVAHDRAGNTRTKHGHFKG